MKILNGERKDETACIKYPYCVECRVPKMRHSSLIVAVNTTRSDIVGISARAIEGAFNIAVKKKAIFRK